MKKIKRITLHNLCNMELEDREKKTLKGGSYPCDCNCSCVENCSCSYARTIANDYYGETTSVNSANDGDGKNIGDFAANYGIAN